MATIPSILKAPQTKAQGWTNQFNYLQSQLTSYNNIIKAIPLINQTAYQIKQLQDAQSGRLNTQY